MKTLLSENGRITVSPTNPGINPQFRKTQIPENSKGQSHCRGWKEKRKWHKRNQIFEVKERLNCKLYHKVLVQLIKAEYGGGEVM